MPALSDPISEFASALEKRERKTWEFDSSTFLANRQSVGKFRMRVASVQEQDDSLVDAHRYVEAKAKESASAAKDVDLLGNAKVAYLLQKVCLHPSKDIPIFPTGKWMLANLSTDELSVLLHHYTEILKLSGPIDLDMSSERIEGLAAMMANFSHTDAPNVALLPFAREQLGEICIRLSLFLKEARESKAGPVGAEAG